MSAERKGAAAKSGVFTRWIEQREGLVEFDFVPFQLIRDSLQHDKHGVVFGQDAPNGEACVGIQRLQLAKEKKTEDVIDVGVEKNGSGDGRMPSFVISGMTMEFGRGFDLCAEVGRGSEEKPVFWVGADGNLRLSAGFALELSGAKGTAVGAGTIPLGETTACGRTQNLDLHGGSLPASVFGNLLVGNPHPPPLRISGIRELAENLRKIHGLQRVTGKIQISKSLAACGTGAEFQIGTKAVSRRIRSRTMMSQVSALGGGNLWVLRSGHKSTRENRCPPCGVCLGFLSLLRSLMPLILHTHRSRGGLHSFAASRLGSRAASPLAARHS